MPYYYAISNPCRIKPSVSLEGEPPSVLALGERRKVVLPVFGSEAALQAFVEVCYTGEEEHFDAFPLGRTFFEVADAIRPAVKAGEVEDVVFDPVLDLSGAWVGQELYWPAKDFCDFLQVMHPTVIEMARENTGVPADEQPSPEAVNEALLLWMSRAYDYLTGNLPPGASLE